MTNVSIGRILCAIALGIGLAPGTAQASQTLDARIAAKVKARLLQEDGSTSHVGVDTVEGLTTLYGVVAADAERLHAAKVASQVQGVRRVRNLLVVLPEARRQEVDASDQRLASELRDALDRAPGLEGSDVRVASVHGGVALLAGRAASLLAHRRAIQAASGVEGLQRVASEIRSPDRSGDSELWQGERPRSLLPQRLADLWLTLRAHWRLLTGMGLTPLDVDVDIHDGVVTLSGVVASLEERVGAEMELMQIEGVREVQSLLRLAPVAHLAAPLPGGMIHARGRARLPGERAVEMARDAAGGRAVLSELRARPVAGRRMPPS